MSTAVMYSRLLSCNGREVAIVAMPHKQTYKMAAKQTSGIDSLGEIPDNISIQFLPNHQQLADRILKRGVNYFAQSYVHDVRIFTKNRPLVSVSGKCWRSMRKKPPIR